MIHGSQPHHHLQQVGAERERGREGERERGKERERDRKRERDREQQRCLYTLNA
jgi:hypothetical protein